MNGAKATQKRIYFGYGSNIWRDQMRRRCPTSQFIGVAILQDWRWIITDLGWANVIPSNGDVVYGFLYELQQSDETQLDKYEGVPKYYIKKRLAIEPLDALVYVNETKLTKGTIAKEYIYRMNMAIADGLEEGLPQDYVDRYLREWVPPMKD
ncbi:hypothetical protein AMATHDRAFT_58642 [Amanita thiersii Skay4041]|uniref:gamma-glutamylcyclotransferase n=1 Tax=Amanita thiersii Skay4041 TaxID=703135 RepID=A0A2A9NVF2_9AGAR|nr:hypothetical protein AMATHDRAFT_58642 [Amanita thiersii Skay4041]